MDTQLPEQGTEQQSPSKVKHDIFEDPAISRAMNEDPILRYMAKWWQQIAFIVCAIVLAFWLRGRFQETWLNSKGEASDLFSRSEQRYSEFVEASLEKEDKKAETKKPEGEGSASEKEDAAKKSEEMKRVLNESLASLAETEAPYSQLADVYRALATMQQGDATKVDGILGVVSLVGKDGSKTDRFVSEMKLLIEAKAFLDNQAKLAEGKAILKKLASEGYFVNVVAAVTLARLAESDTEREEAKRIINKILETQPEQAQFLQDEVNRLTVS